jgi:hypothetical protein
MATTVQNPFDTQQPAATNQSPTSSAGIVSSALPQPGTGMTYTPETRQVNAPTETVQGQVNSILAKDSPLMQRARTLATQSMAQRGLVNSSMAQGAGTAAMIDRALPIAQQDANTYSGVSQDNMNARNRAVEFGAGQLNQFAQQQSQQNFQGTQAQLEREQQTALQQSQQNFQGTQAQLERAQQTALQTSQQDFTAKQQTIQNDFNRQLQQLQESGLSQRQATEIASREAMVRLEQAGIANRFDRELALKSSQFNIEQYNLERRQLLQNQAQLDQLNLQIRANRDTIPTSFAANISNTAMAGVNAILADGNMNADAKKGAIANLVSYANAQISWAEKFYGTTIPRVTTPV